MSWISRLIRLFGVVVSCVLTVAPSRAAQKLGQEASALELGVLGTIRPGVGTRRPWYYASGGWNYVSRLSDLLKSTNTYAANRWRS